MLLREIVLPGILLPALAALAVGLLDLRWWRAEAPRPSRAGAAALAVAFMATFVAIGDVPALPPIETADWLFWIAAVIGGLGLIWHRAPASARLLTASILTIALVLLTARPLIGHTWTVAAGSAWLVGSVSAIGALWWGLASVTKTDLEEKGDLEEGVDRRSRFDSLLQPIAAMAFAGGSAVVLGLSGTARLALLSGALAAGIGACEAVRWILSIRRDKTPPLLDTPISGVVALLGGGLLLNGAYYAEVPWWALGLTLAPAIATVARSTSAGDRGRWLAIAVLALVSALVVVPVVYGNLGAEADSYYDY